ncbi:MAG: EamA/RhaT family transporter [Candidatus Kapabacteria bacterium]|nr:EamA/RhaT family transporter [Candidatus Kapabacteria bacterium]
MNNKHHAAAVAALVVCAILWSSGGLLIKLLPLSPLAIAGLRSAIAAAVMFLWIRRKGPLKPAWTPAQFGSIISYMFTVVLFVWATKKTTAANAILLQYTAPVWVAIFSATVAKERLARRDVIVVGCVMLGMVVFFLDALSPGAILGNALAIASGVAFAGVALFMRQQRGTSTTESIILGNVLTAIVCAPLAGALPPATMDWILPLLVLGMLQLGVSYLLYSWALAHVTALEAVLITVLEPLLNPLWVGLALGEVPSSTSILGGAIVISAILGGQALRRNSRE